MRSFSSSLDLDCIDRQHTHSQLLSHMPVNPSPLKAAVFAPQLPQSQFYQHMGSPPMPQALDLDYSNDYLDFGDPDLAQFPQHAYLSPVPWSHLSDGAAQQNPSTPFGQAPQQPQQKHHRALSTSSGASVATDSPYSRASSIQYPTTVSHPAQRFSSPWEAYSSPPPTVQHLPTPTRTPNRESFMNRSEGVKGPPVARDAGNTSRRRVQAGSRPTPQFLSAQPSEQHRTATQSSAGAASEAQYAPIATRHIPKFDRTMSDIYQDELYNPATVSSVPTAGPQQVAQGFQPQHTHSVMNERLQEANFARSMNVDVNMTGSPYQDGPRYTPMGVNASGSFQRHIQTAAELRQQQKRESDAVAYEQHHARPNEAQPSTVSPQDAFPEQPEPEEEPSLFADESNRGAVSDTPMYGPPSSQGMPAKFNFSMPSSNFGLNAASMPSNLQTPDIKYTEQAFGSGQASEQRQSYSTPSQTRESSRSDVGEDEEQDFSDSQPEKPQDTAANGGTYSCTYHGCPERFQTPAELQRHKREGHRSTGTHRTSTDMTQAGPHKCTRINPTTGKPCNTVFSRPYDLTRHEFSLHSYKKKLRCPHCTEEKLFSRQDALTRHMRVCHTSVAVPSKHRRRLGRSA